MKIANADKLKKHFENVVDVKLFTPAQICTIIDTFSSEVDEEDLISRKRMGQEVFNHNYLVPVLENENEVLGEVLQMIHKAPSVFGGTEP